ncbi:MAG: ATP synthase subunit I [Methylomonas lenta]|nr:ATP synthase subunit I [Methylomonas lenta]
MAVENQFSTVGKILSVQVLVAVAVALGFLVVGGPKSATDALAGSGVALVPNLYFAYKIYLARNQAAQGVLNAFYAGESIKLLLTAALFAMALQIPSVDFLTLLTGFVAVLSVFWFALFYWRD